MALIALLPLWLRAQATVAAGDRVRVHAERPVDRWVWGRLVQLTTDSVIVLADPPARLLPTREAFAVTQLRSLHVSRRTMRGAVIGALLFGGLAGFLASFDETDRSHTGFIVGAGFAGLLIGNALHSHRWVRVQHATR